jgi:hypothetical protein
MRHPMIICYLQLMLILPIVVLTLALITLMTSGNLHHVFDMVLGVGIILVVINLSGVLCMMAPVSRYLTDDGTFRLPESVSHGFPFYPAHGR